MLIMLSFLVGIGLIGAIVTLVSVLHNLDLSEMMPVYKPKKKNVGAAFWGCYQDASSNAQEPQSIKLPKITFNPEAVVGSELYSKGFAVKSAKR